MNGLANCRKLILRHIPVPSGGRFWIRLLLIVIMIILRIMIMARTTGTTTATSAASLRRILGSTTPATIRSTTGPVYRKGSIRSSSSLCKSGKSEKSHYWLAASMTVRRLESERCLNPLPPLPLPLPLSLSLSLPLSLREWQSPSLSGGMPKNNRFLSSLTSISSTTVSTPLTDTGTTTTRTTLPAKEENSLFLSVAINNNKEHTSTASAIASATYATKISDGSRNQQPYTATTTTIHSHRYSIFDMDAAEIQKVTRLVDLQDLVTQVEAMPVLDAADVGPLLLPLTRLTSMKTYGHEGALLTERLLLTCLSRLPVEISDRYLTATTTTADATAAATKVCTIPTHFSSSGDATTSHTLPQQLRTTLPYPTTALYNRAMIAWGNLSTRQGAERAQLLFQWQLQEYVREKEYLRDQHSRSFRGTDGNDVVDSSSSSTSSAVYNQTMPPQPQQQLNQQRHHVAASLLLPAEPFAPPPDRRCYKSLIRAWAVSKDVKGAARAYDILQEMELLSGVTALLDGRGVTALRRQQQQQAEQKLPLIPPIEMPDMGTYNVVLSAYGKAFVLKHPNALERIRQIVQRVHDLHEATGSDEFQLDGYSYVSILQAYSRYVAYCPSPLDKKYSLEILAILRDIHQLLEKRRNDDNKLEQPPPPRYSEAYKKGLDDHPTKLDPDRSFLFPLSISWAYGVAVDALVKTEPFYESILLADDIVMAMARRPNRCTAPPSNVFDSLPPPLLTPSPPLSIPYFVATEIWPPHETLLRVVLGWERSGLPQAAERIERLLNIVVVGASYPRIYHMHETMELWCVSGWPAAPVLVEKILSRALSNYTGIVNKPTGQSFGIAMKAWMRSKQKESPYRAELLLQHMLHLYEDEGDSWYRPREVHTRYVTTCWLQRCKDGQRYDGISGKNMYPAEHCESLVLWLRGKDWFDKMAIGQYAMAIRAWATQQILTTENDGDDDNDPNPVLRASKLLDYYAESLSGRDELLLPAFLCNWVLAACLRWQPNVQRRLVAYDVAIETFKRCKHNARTFVLTVQVLRAQVPELDEEHLSVISDLFEQCCACGMLTQEMIAEVVDVVQPEALQRLFGLSYQMAQLIAAEGLKATENDNSFRARTPSVLLVGNLPQEWSVNAQMKGKPTDVCSNK